MRIVIFGTGKMYTFYKQCFSSCQIICFLDNDKNKQGKLLDGIKICSPQMIKEFSYDYIYILSNKYNRFMKKQLFNYGVIERKIKEIPDIMKLGGKSLSRTVICKGKQKNNSITKERKKILFISNGLSLTGAPIACFYAAVILEKSGYDVCVASDSDGPLKMKYISENISLIIDPNICISRIDNIDKISSFDLAIVNTFCFNYLFYDKHIDIPIIWWIHEAEEFYCLMLDSKINLDGVSILAVGNVAKNNFSLHFPNKQVNELLYGIPDIAKKHTLDLNRIVFAVIGTICTRKGQDVFLEAISKLPKEIKKRCEFWLIGNFDSVFGDDIRKRGKGMQGVQCFGELDHDRLMKLYPQITVLVCPSREDPMPVVITEAMMNYKPVLMSAESIGNAVFVHNGIDGLLFNKEDSEDLSQKIEWCYKNRMKLADIGEHGRKIYEQYFSLDIFESNLLNIVRKLIG